MSTTPPEQPQRPMYGRGMNIQGTMPIPGNAELVVYLAATILIAIIALASDAVNSGAFVTAYTAITFAYLISRNREGVARLRAVTARRSRTAASCARAGPPSGSPA